MSHLGDKHLARITDALERQSMLEEYRLLREVAGSSSSGPLPGHQRARLTWLKQELWPEPGTVRGSTETG